MGSDWDGVERREHPTPLDAIDDLRRDLLGWRLYIGPILAAALVAVVVSLGFTKLVDDSNEQGAKTAANLAAKTAVKTSRSEVANGQRQGCGQSNVQKAVDRYLIGRTVKAYQPIFDASRPIIWCERSFTTANAGETRYLLTGRSLTCFVDLAGTGYFKGRTPFTDPARLLHACRRR